MPEQIQTLGQVLADLPDDVLQHLQFAVPWQFSPTTSDYEGDPDRPASSVKTAQGVDAQRDLYTNRNKLQQECFAKAIANPQINTSVRGIGGRLCGTDFEISSDMPEILDAIREIETDYRNRLYTYYNKWVERANIEGELFLGFSVHPDGFIEVDFYDPSSITGGSRLTQVKDKRFVDGDGIIFHPQKPTLPLFYCVDSTGSGTVDQLIPSVYVARNPKLAKLIDPSSYGINADAANACRMPRSKVYQTLGGYYRFMVNWDRSFITPRNVSHLRTTLEWLNHYEDLKKYEIDHKKSSGAYLWKVMITDARAFRIWVSLTDDERRATGIMAKKTPGSTLVMPPGMDIQPINPNLPRISDADTDILAMISSGLNEPVDVTMGSSNSPFASVKASRGPLSDRISDESAYFARFLRYDFWGSIFFLKSAVSGFPDSFEVKEAVGFNKKKTKNPMTGIEEDDVEPIIKEVSRRPEELIDINFPSSEIINTGDRSSAMLGVKHGSVTDVLGIPRSEVARRLGFGNYRRLRLQAATEEERYPSLIQNIDAEAMQERTQAEPPVNKVKQTQNGNGKSNGDDKKKADFDIDEFKSELVKINAESLQNHLNAAITPLTDQFEAAHVNTQHWVKQYVTDFGTSLTDTLRDLKTNVDTAGLEAKLHMESKLADAMGQLAQLVTANKPDPQNINITLETPKANKVAKRNPDGTWVFADAED